MSKGEADHDRTAHKARLMIPRKMAADLGHETAEILRRGYYLSAFGRCVDIGDQVAASVRGTVSYPPDQTVMLPKKTVISGALQIEVRNETTLEAAKSLMALGFRPAALNFASATHPGGGFLHGARAQEEYLARSSALWACLRDNAMYPYHRARKDPFYSDYVIYSPDVPVFRDDGGALLDTPYPCSMVTPPAVQADAVRRYCPRRQDEIADVLRKRIRKVLAVAAKHGHQALVLGAWGCGAFGNCSEEMARLFREALHEHYGCFKHIVFAITDWTEDQHFIGPFLREFIEGGFLMQV